MPEPGDLISVPVVLREGRVTSTVFDMESNLNPSFFFIFKFNDSFCKICLGIIR